MRSRVLRSPNDAIRLPLNMSVSRETQIARALTTYQGGGCSTSPLAGDDLFSAVAAARERGLKTLHIPDNYYQDLMARLDLDADFLAQLQRYDVLYDRDEQGGSCCTSIRFPMKRAASSLSCWNDVAAIVALARPMLPCG
ncbi:hypothetical protein WDV93_05510 [Pantoea ananatis]